MLTYSINLGTPTETTSYPITNNLVGNDSSFNQLINKILDNEYKIIKPREIRDFLLSVNSSTVFKLTNNESGSFIGFDKGYPNDPDLKGYKIIIGNRLDIDNNPILDENVTDNTDDIILSKTTNLNKNKISFLTNSEKQPYIEVGIDMNISNEDGVNIKSLLDKVNINNIKFPSIADNEQDLNNKYLITDSGELIWDNLTVDINSDDILTDENNIIGELNLNNYSLEFKDNRRIPIEIGDIKLGQNFNNIISITDVLKRIIYNYSPPDIKLSFIEPNQYNAMEFNSDIIPKVKYEIYKKTLPLSVSFINMNPSFIQPITEDGYIKKTGILDCILGSLSLNSINNFTISVNDSQNVITEDINIKVVYPLFYGFSIDSINNPAFINSITKLIIDKKNISLEIKGDGSFYFIYPHSYGLLTSIIGLNTPNIFSYIFNSPDSYWNNIRFYVYRFNNISITELENISFVF